MDLPPLDKEMLENMGISSTVMLTPPASVIYHRSEPQRVAPLTTEDCLRLFGTRESVQMTFIPQMLTALALEQCEAFIKYCRDHRLSEFKRHTRELRKCIYEYNYELRKSYGSAWYAYQRYLERLRESVEMDLFKCWCTFTNEATRQYVGHPHKEIPARVAMTRMLFTFVEDFDKEVDRVIESKIGRPCNRMQDPYCVLVSALCCDIAETFGQMMEITESMALCVRILANRCRTVADEIISNETPNEK